MSRLLLIALATVAATNLEKSTFDMNIGGNRATTPISQSNISNCIHDLTQQIVDKVDQAEETEVSEEENDMLESIPIPIQETVPVHQTLRWVMGHAPWSKEQAIFTLCFTVFFYQFFLALIPLILDFFEI